MTSIAVRRFHSLLGPALTATAVVTSAWSGARLVGLVPTSAAGQLVRSPPPPARAAPDPPRPARDGAALVARNMFCATCPSVGPRGAGEPPAEAPRFAGRLIATHVESATRGTATLYDPITGAGGGFATGAVVAGGAVIVAVRPGALDVRFSDGVTETVTLAAGPGPRPDRPPTTPPTTPWADQVRDLGDGRFELDRQLIGDLVGRGTASTLPGVRLVPVTSGGQLAGIKVSAARTGSLAHALGLEPGDVIEAVDGKPIDSAAMLMALYGQTDRLTRLELTVRRHGEVRQLAYQLR